MLYPRGAALLLLGAALGTTACTRTVTERTREVGPWTPAPSSRPPALPADGARWEASIVSEPPVVTGTIAWSRRCLQVETRDVAVVEQRRTVSNVPANLLWLLGGGGLAVGSGALVVDAAGADSAAKAREVPLAIALGAFGTAAVVGALGGFFPPDDGASMRERVVEDRPGATRVPCGDAPPPRIIASMVVEGVRVEARSTASGTFGFVVPIGLAPRPATLRADVRARDAGSADDAAGGVVVGTVDLVAFARARARPPALWSGEAVAEGVAFTARCTPRGPDRACSGHDDDCDGFYDLGCGVRPGQLQWTLYSADTLLALTVQGPDGIEVSIDHPQGGAAGVLFDGACAGPRPCTPARSNVYVPLDREPQLGTYIARIAPAAKGFPEAHTTLTGWLVGRAGNRSFGGAVSLRPERGWQASLAIAIGDDRDHDAIIDAQDRCPDAPGPLELRGCPASRRSP